MSRIVAELDVAPESPNDQCSLFPVQERDAQVRSRNSSNVRLQNAASGSNDTRHPSPAELAELHRTSRLMVQDDWNVTNQIPNYVKRRDNLLYHADGNRWQLEQEDINKNKRVLEWMEQGVSAVSRLSLQPREAASSQEPEIGRLLEDNSNSSPDPSDTLSIGQTSFATAFTSSNTPSFRSDTLSIGQTSFSTAFTGPNTPSFRSAASSISGSLSLSVIPEDFPSDRQALEEDLHSDIVPRERPAGVEIDNDQASRDQGSPGGSNSVTEYRLRLELGGLLLPSDQELNWSGKGQHVEFEPSEPLPLDRISKIGAGAYSEVDKVLCRRIVLARKLMKLSRRWTLTDAMNELQHLHKLRHAHIIQLVGSYTLKRNFAILLYPAADCNLFEFLTEMSEILDLIEGGLQTANELDNGAKSLLEIKDRMLDALAASLGCLASATAFVHQNTIKHMDIKPQNVLVKRMPLSIKPPECPFWRVYLADFGLSRSFEPHDLSQTEGHTLMTAKYCAPEVYDYAPRGRKADVFSLGCVYLEILTVYVHMDLDDFKDFRQTDNYESSFHKSLPKVEQWADKLVESHIKQRKQSGLSPEEQFRSMICFLMTTLNNDPERRPTSFQLAAHFDKQEDIPVAFVRRRCCLSPPEPYVVEPIRRPTAQPVRHLLALGNT